MLLSMRVSRRLDSFCPPPSKASKVQSLLVAASIRSVPAYFVHTIKLVKDTFESTDSSENCKQCRDSFLLTMTGKPPTKSSSCSRGGEEAQAPAQNAQNQPGGQNNAGQGPDQPAGNANANAGQGNNGQPNQDAREDRQQRTRPKNRGPEK